MKDKSLQEFMENHATNIVHYRLLFGYSIETLAKEAKVPVEYLKRVEEARTSCSGFVNQKIADVLGIDPQKLYEERNKYVCKSDDPSTTT